MLSTASMENSKKRWSVTYTKHIKQKRKVFQDGFLDLHTSTNKVNLFDDCDKLLESKILKGDECVKSGETLTFNGFLVDVGDPEGVVEVDVKFHRRPVADSNFKEIGRKIAERPTPNFSRRRKFRSPVSTGDNKDDVEKSKTQLNNTSPSRKVIRDFKRSEFLRYEASKSRPETIQTGVTEWHVLYTTQVTQKAKKYHDGFLRLKDGQPLGRQIMLYDESKNVLNTRFLKKDEIIRSDESVAFDGHLVDIGEPKKENPVSVDLNAEGNIINFVGKEERTHEHQNLLDSKKFLVAKGEDAGSRGISAADPTKKCMTVPQNKPLRETHQILSILQKPIARGTAIPGCIEDNEVKHISSAEGLQVLDAKVDFSKGWLLRDESVQNDGPIHNKNIGGSSKGMSTLGSAQPTCGGRSENPVQDNTEGRPAIWSNEALASGFSSLENVFIPHGSTNDEMKSSGERKLEEWPSFDLGF